MNRDQKVTLQINGGLDPSLPARTIFTGKVGFNFVKSRPSAPSNSTGAARASLKVGMSIPKENIRQSSQPMLLGLIRKAFATQTKSSLIPTSLYELLKNDHIRAEVQDNPQDIEIQLSSGGPLEKAVSYFLGNLLSKKEFEVEAPQQIDISFRSQVSVRKALINYCQNDSFDDFFSFLYQNSEFVLHATVCAEVAGLLDSLVTAMQGRAVFPIFAFSQECDIKIAVDYVSPVDEFNYWHAYKTTSTLCFECMNGFFAAALDYFQSMSQEESKTMAKFIDFLGKEGQPAKPLGLSLDLAGFGKAEFSVPLEEMRELLEFVAYHPRPKDAELVKKYKETFLEKVRQDTPKRNSK